MESRWVIFNFLQLILISNVYTVDYMFIELGIFDYILMRLGTNCNRKKLKEPFGLIDCEILGDIREGVEKRESEE